MSFSPDALLTRRQTLEAHGFTVVSHTPDELIAVRMRGYPVAAVRLTTVVRVRRVALAERAALSQQLSGFFRQAGQLDPSRIPRGFMQMRIVLDVVLADAVGEGAAAFARSAHKKGMGASGQVYLVQPDGQVDHPKVTWGRAYVPWIEHAGQLAATGEDTPAPPTSTSATIIGLLYMWPAVVTLVLMTCGMALLLFFVLRAMEKKPASAALPVG